MATPAWNSSSATVNLFTAAATNITVNFPGTNADGDLIVVQLQSRDNAGNTITPTFTESGYTKIGEHDNSSPPAAFSARVNLQLFAKVTTGGETSVTLQIDNYVQQNGVVLHRFTSADGWATTPTILLGSNNDINVTTHSTTGYSTINDDSLAAWFFGIADDQPLTSSAGTGWTFNTHLVSNNLNDAAYGLATKPMATSGTSGSVSGTTAAIESWTSMMVDLRVPVPASTVQSRWGWQG